MTADGSYRGRVSTAHEAPLDAQLRTWSLVAKLGSNGSSLLPPAVEAVRLAD
jgi:hypothetical protein